MKEEKKYKLVDRAQFCPIGTTGNCRMLPATFVKLCLHHQNNAEHMKGYEGASSVLHSLACGICPVANDISKGVDPIRVVANVEWITPDELQLLQSSAVARGVIRTIETKIRKINTVAKGHKDRHTKREALKKMKEKLIRIQKLLIEISDAVDSIVKEIEVLSAFEKAVVKTISTPITLKKPIVNPSIPAVFQKVLSNVNDPLKGVVDLPVKPKVIDYKTAVNNCLTKMKEETFNLSVSVYKDTARGKSIKEIAASHNKSPKYIGELLHKYRSIVSAL